MADQVVQITPGSGTKIDVSELTVGANVVERQRIVLASNTVATDYATIFPAGFLRTSDEPHQTFYDPFDASPDTTNAWTIASGNSGIAATVTTGQMTLGTGLSASGYSSLTSIPIFTPTIPAWLGASFAIQIENPVQTNAVRFWGFGTAPGSPTAAAPLTNAVGFEIDATGKLFAVVYSGGSRTAVADLSTATGNATQPADANYHRYIIYVRTDRTYWYIDNLATSVASSSFQSPQIQTLPVRMQAVGGLTPPSPTASVVCAGLAVWDTGKNSAQLSDGTRPWRKAQVGANGGLAIMGATIAGTSGSIAATSTGTVGPLAVAEAGNTTFIVKNTVATSAYAGNPVLVFEQSDDNVSWGPLWVVRADTNVANSTFTLVPNTSNASLMFDAALEGASYVRCRVTTGPATNAMTIAIQPGGTLVEPVVTIGSGNVGGFSTVVTASAFTRPANTTAYASGQLVANSVTAGSVTPISVTLARTMAGTGEIRRVRLLKSGTSVTTAVFRVHLYRTSPTVTNGDGGVWLSNNAANYMGSLDLTMTKAFSDGAVGVGIPTEGSELFYNAPAGLQTIFALIEARSAYTPVSGETFTLTVEAYQN